MQGTTACLLLVQELQGFFLLLFYRGSYKDFSIGKYIGVVDLFLRDIVDRIFFYFM